MTEPALFGILFLIFTLVLGRIIHAHGKKFISHAFGEDSPLSTSVAFLLNLGWYLVCFGLLFWNLGVAGSVGDYGQIARGVFLRLGISIFVVGVLHGINILSISLLHRKNRP